MFPFIMLYSASSMFQLHMMIVDLIMIYIMKLFTNVLNYVTITLSLQIVKVGHFWENVSNIAHMYKLYV